MPGCLTNKDIQNLIKKTTKKVAQQKKKPKYEDETVIKSPEAEDQEDLDNQFSYMKKRDF